MHQVTGTIRKAPYTKTGSNSKGEWKLYSIELSESWKDKSGEKKWTNYRAAIFASSPGSINYNDEVLVEGSVVSISCEVLRLVTNDSNGKSYTNLEMDNPRVVFAKAPEGAAPQQQSPQQHGWGKPQQPEPRQQAPQQASNEPPMDFDDDIPFAPIGLQYARHAIYSI